VTAMCDTCDDSRFELIKKYKQKLLDATNIEDSPEEMAVIDNILFRFWQMGWFEKLELFGNSEQLESGHEKDHVGDSNKMVGDLVSRQAAIDALDVLCQEHRYKIPGKIETYSQYNEAWQDALDRAEGAIFNLPSSQPERTCVNCGRTANNGGWYADGGTRCPIEEHYALPKDGFCHLWEKRNITDDDYPERRTDE